MTALFKDLQLSRLAEEGADFELRHPATGEPLGWKLRIRGTDAPTLRALELEQRRRRLEQLAKSGGERVDPLHLDEEVIEMLMAATLGWSGIEIEPGVAMEFNAQNVRAMYAEKWVREQVSTAISTRANFFPRSASGS